MNAFEKMTQDVFGDVTASKGSAMARTASVINDERRILVREVCNTRSSGDQFTRHLSPSVSRWLLLPRFEVRIVTRHVLY
jgi:hypothetical protein